MQFRQIRWNAPVPVLSRAIPIVPLASGGAPGPAAGGMAGVLAAAAAAGTWTRILSVIGHCAQRRRRPLLAAMRLELIAIYDMKTTRFLFNHAIVSSYYSGK